MPPLACWGGQGGTGGDINLPLPVPFNPGFFWLPPLCTFSIAKYYAMLHNFSLFLPLPATLGIPLPAPSSPASRIPPAPFSPGLPPPCPPPPLAYLEVLVVPFKDGDPTDCCTQQLSRGFCTLYA